MTGYKLLYLTSLVIFTFGALTFSVLTLLYWRERKLRRQSGGSRVFPAFTRVCAAAFLLNLVARFAAVGNAGSAWADGLSASLDLVTGFIPPLLFHLILVQEGDGLPSRAWRWILAAFYGLSITGAVLQAAGDAGLGAGNWSDSLESLRAAMLGTAGVLGLLAIALSRRKAAPLGRRHRVWNGALLLAMLLAAAANLAQPGTFAGLLPDYLVLGFFCVTLYYKERLVFFDLLIKRGAFFAVALAGLTLYFLLSPSITGRLPADWSRPWISALLLTPFWLMGPWIYGRMASGIDRRLLRRRYPVAEAERQFDRDMQVAEGEEDLRARAEASLSDIFRSPAEVRFGAGDMPTGDAGIAEPMEHQGVRVGWLAVSAKPGGIPYMSDERRLLQSLTRTLGVVLENVRFRQQRIQQEEREQQLRLLASRAELKALRAQINPHFLFNALNAIAGLIPADPGLAEETVEQLAEVFRYTLRKSEKEWVRLDEEMEFVVAYLRVEQARFGERLQVEFLVDAAAGTIPIPAMTVQPLVENAIKHGVSVLETAGRVSVHAALRDGALWIEVRDNGPGFPTGFSLAEPGGHGLRNIAERVRGYYGDCAQLGWESQPAGTRVFLKMPQPAPDPDGRSFSDTRSDRRR